MLSATDRFGDAPFAQARAWSYVAGHKPFNLAAGVPLELLERLSEPEGANAAIEASAVPVLTDLRNALAHGGIAFLDERGRQSGGEAAMLTFVRAVMTRNRITAVNVLRVGERDYRRFLSEWASRLRRSGVSAALSDWAA